MKQKRQSGFTITELVIATAVFAGVLLLVIVGFVQIGRLFYKGVAVTQTRQTTSNVMNAVTSDIRLSGNFTPVSFTCNPNCYLANPISAFCIGNHLYVANVHGDPVNLTAGQHDTSSKFGLLQSQLANGNCSTPRNDQAFLPADLVNPIEMLGDDMRVTKFDVKNAAIPNSTLVAVTVAYGEDSVFLNLGADTPTCKGISTGSQFCAVIPMSTLATDSATFTP